MIFWLFIISYHLKYPTSIRTFFRKITSNSIHQLEEFLILTSSDSRDEFLDILAKCCYITHARIDVTEFTHLISRVNVAKSTRYNFEPFSHAFKDVWKASEIFATFFLSYYKVAPKHFGRKFPAWRSLLWEPLDEWVKVDW